MKHLCPPPPPPPPRNGLVTRYTHVKYDGPNSYQSKDMVNVKFLRTNKQTGQKPYVPDL